MTRRFIYYGLLMLSILFFDPIAAQTKYSECQYSVMQPFLKLDQMQNQNVLHITFEKCKDLINVDVSYDESANAIIFDIKTLMYSKIRQLLQNSEGLIKKVHWDDRTTGSLQKPAKLVVYLEDNLQILDVKKDITTDAFIFKFPVKTVDVTSSQPPEITNNNRDATETTSSLPSIISATLREKPETVPKDSYHEVSLIGVIILEFDREIAKNAYPEIKQPGGFLSFGSQNKIELVLDKRYIQNTRSVINSLNSIRNPFRQVTGWRVSIAEETTQKIKLEITFTENINKLALRTPIPYIKNDHQFAIITYFDINLDAAHYYRALNNINSSQVSQADNTSLQHQQPTPAPEPDLIPAPEPDQTSMAIPSDYELALQQLEEAKKNDNTSLMDQAIEQLEKFTEANPEDLEALYLLGNAYFDRKKYIGTMNTFRQLMEKDIHRQYPEALFTYCLSQYAQYSNCGKEHAQILQEYLSLKTSKNIDLLYEEDARLLINKCTDKVECSTISEVAQFQRYEQIISQDDKSILHFWASWCGPCIEELPGLFKFANENPDVNYFIISVDRQQDKYKADNLLNEKFAPFKSRTGDNVYFLHDPEKLTLDLYLNSKERKKEVYPMTLFIRRDQRLKTSIGKTSWGNLQKDTIW